MIILTEVDVEGEALEWLSGVGWGVTAVGCISPIDDNALCISCYYA